MSDRVLSQEEIDSVFRNAHGVAKHDDPSRRAQPYDFRRPDRIAKDQLRSIHLLHENFARSLASSLSAYLRAYVMVNLVSVEQLSFLEFSQCLPAPSSIVSLSLKPYDGSAILELNPTLVFPILEMLLGGSGKSAFKANREVTEIEQSILEGVLRIVLHDLQEAWSPITNIRFAVESHETEPQLLQILAPNEAVVAVAIEIRIGEVAGMMNVGIPSILIKMLRQKFDQQWSVRKTKSNDDEHARMLRLIQDAVVEGEVLLRGPHMPLDALMSLKEGDLITFDFPLHRPLDLLINGQMKFRGEIVATGRKRAFETHDLMTQEG